MGRERNRLRLERDKKASKEALSELIKLNQEEDKRKSSEVEAKRKQEEAKKKEAAEAKKKADAKKKVAPKKAVLKSSEK
jgi:hypothetical protein